MNKQKSYNKQKISIDFTQTKHTADFKLKTGVKK